MSLQFNKLPDSLQGLLVHLVVPFHALLHVVKLDSSLVEDQYLVWILNWVVLRLLIFTLFDFFCLRFHLDTRLFSQQLTDHEKTLVDDRLSLVIHSLETQDLSKRLSRFKQIE